MAWKSKEHRAALKRRIGLYYNESGIVPVWSQPLMVAAGLTVAVVISPFVALLSVMFVGCAAIGFLFPAVFFLPGGHGALVFVAVDSTATACSVRSRKAVRLVTFFCICVAFYFFVHGFAWAFAGFGWDRYFETATPGILWHELTLELATWHIAGQCMAGLFALIFFGLYLIPVFIDLNDRYPPYCEPCGCFCRAHPTIVPFPFMETTQFEQGDFTTLIPVEADARTGEYFEAEIYPCRRCDETAFLRVWKVTRTPKPKAEDEWREDKVLEVDLLRVPIELTDRFDEAGDWD